MSRWALFAAHRYVRAGAAVPRHVGADGRPLRRPWRVVTVEVERAARRQRAQRRQPLWPRLLGVVLLGVAGVAALHPVGPVPTHVAASASARTGAGLHRLHAVSPVGDVTSPPAAFRWRSAVPGTVAFVLCDASYVELLRVGDLDGEALATDGALAALLAGGGTFHWWVEAGAADALERSRLESFTIR